MYDSNTSLYQREIGISLENLVSEVEKTFKDSVKIYSINYRTKSPIVLEKKLALKKTQDIFCIKDIYGIRVLVETEENAYYVLAGITKSFSGFLKNDYILNPKTKDLDKLRLLQFIAYRRNIPFEIQITTYAFHEVNEVFHQRYHVEKYGI